MAIPVFDLHCDTAVRIGWASCSPELRETLGRDYYYRYDAENPAEACNLAKNHCMVSLEKTAAQPWAQCLAIFIPDELTPEQSIAYYNQIAAYRSDQLAQNAGVASAVTGASQIREILEGNAAAGKGSSATASSSARFAGVATIENARFFAADMSLVEKLAHEGVLMASLSWNAAGPLASGHDTHEGLSALGREALAEMERTGMVMDVSHLNDECFAEVAQLSSKPFVASHSNARAVCNHPRNLTDDQFRCIADCGGVVGLNYCGGFITEGAWGIEKAAAVTFDELAAHIEHWLDLGGEDVIALGGDWDGADVPSFLADASCMSAFQAALTQSFGEDTTRKLCYANALRFFEENAN